MRSRRACTRQANGSAANIQFDSSDSTLTTFGSVIALPVEGPNCNVEAEDVIKSLDALGSTDSGGYNYSDDTSCDLTGTGDRQGAADPQLTALGPNGGPTETRPPTETSPLVDGVPLAACHPDGIAVDQRGITRPQRDGCDIGAVELVFTAADPGSGGAPAGRHAALHRLTPHCTNDRRRPASCRAPSRQGPGASRPRCATIAAWSTTASPPDPRPSSPPGSAPRSGRAASCSSLYLDRIERLNGPVNAVVTLDADRARGAADAADARAGAVATRRSAARAPGHDQGRDRDRGHPLHRWRA